MPPDIIGGTNISIDCTTNTYSVSVAVSGLSGTGLVLQLNGGNDLTIAGNGPYNFAPSLIDGESFSVTVLTQPSAPMQTCVVTGGSGTVSAADVNVNVACTIDRYTVGGARWSTYGALQRHRASRR